MTTYRTKTRLLNAVSVEESLSGAARPDWLNEAIEAGKVVKSGMSLHIKTDGADLICNPGDWIICFEDGTLARASDDEFAANYEAVHPFRPVH